MPAGWRLGDSEAGEISNIAWWDQFEDPILSQLVRTALANNKDLEIATANVDQAAAQYGIVRSAQFPQLNANVAGGARALEHDHRSWSASGRGEFSDFAVNLSASFELDIWGRLRRASESARASLLASEQGKGTVVLTVVTSVATGYIQLRSLDRQLEIAQYTSQSLGEAARLQQVRFEEGAVPESDYQQAESQYREAVARVPELEREIAQQENFISVLLGRNPGPIPRGRDIDALLFPAVPSGLPAVTAGASSRHPSGRAEPDRRQCRHRRGQGGLLPRHQPDGAIRLGERTAFGSVQRPVQGLVLWRQRAAADLQCRAESKGRSRRPRPCNDRRSTRTKSRLSARSRTSRTR